ncbi:hypothetical protein [Kineosporia succinea]
MVWFIIDDGFSEHPKTMAIKRATRLPSLGLWTMAGNWSARHLTDGQVSVDLLLEKGGRRTQIQALVDSGLWHDHESTCPHDGEQCPATPAPGGVVFHDWFDWQRSRQDVLQLRARRSAAGRNGGRASGAGRRQERSKNQARASTMVEPPALTDTHPSPNLIDLVCRRLFGDNARDVNARSELIALWQDAAGSADLGAELRNFLIRNADTHLNDPSAALLGWLGAAAERAAVPGSKVVLGCENCNSGWLADEPETGMPVPCPNCKPHRYAQGQAGSPVR